MASFVTKKKAGRPYLYWVRSGRVNGKPRIVEQIYLGPKDRVMQQIRDFYTGAAPSVQPLKKVQVRRFGGPALLWSLAEEWGLAELVDRHVPPAPPEVRTTLSVGQYIVLAAINRVLAPRSKRAFDAWYRRTVLTRVCPAESWELTSQRFWDHMDLISADHIEAIQRSLLETMGTRLSVGEQCLLYDTTNYYTFIDTFNRRTQLAQRGRNKQRRNDLRQLSLSLVVDEPSQLPLYHQLYEGHRADVTQFASILERLQALLIDGAEFRSAEQLTLVFDKGNVSQANVESLEGSAFHYIGALPLAWVSDLAHVPLKEYQPLPLPGTRRVKVLRTRAVVLGAERTVVVVFSPSFFRDQRRTLNKLQTEAEQKLLELRHQVLTAAAAGKPKKASSVQRTVNSLTRRDHLSQFFHCDLRTTGDHVVDLQWRWDQAQKRALQRRCFGKTALLTDLEHWPSERIVGAYRAQARAENCFRITKTRRPGLWWPIHHWTDSKLHVHALYCHFALLLLSLILRRLRHQGLSLSATETVDRLNEIQEALFLYANGDSQRVIADMDRPQKEVFDALGLAQLASQLGNTLL